MEAAGTWYHGVGVGVGVILALTTWIFLNHMWFKPKRIEKSLRAQGLKGSSYRFMFGDLKETVLMTHQAKSKPIHLTDDIVPRVSPFYLKSIAAYGKICFTWLGPKPMVHITEPEMIREILNNYPVFQKSRGGNPLMRILVSGLLDTEAQQWVKHRKIISPAFHVDKLKYMVPAFYVCCNEMIAKWEAMLTEGNSCEVDVWPHLQTMTNDVISRAVFGSNFQEGRKIFDLQQQLTELVLKAAQSMYIPGLRFLPTKSNKKIKEIDRKVKASVKGIIDTRVAAMKAGENSNDDLLGFLLNSNYQEIKQDRNKNSGLTTEEIIEECKLFYLAGQETTLNFLVWTMVLLSQHTNWQIHARNEVLQVFGDNEPDFEGLSHLKVVSMIFNEVLRLYPPVINIDRKVHKETKLGDLVLAPGTLLKINTLLLHHDREIWGNDVKEFKRERFFEGVSKATNGQLCYLPFGGGPRLCIGQNFAILQAKMVLVMILQRFSFELSTSYSHAPHIVLTLQPQLGAYLILRKH
uniref:cytochrome P450 CYP72A219-like isoform X1 n=1 Tax=Erigeron canadensis TaxID=72917 RepID=UPI001CB965C6|nr:cytochrome P450 CYP72A219-like isoform X1 [Erigeron canadensis]